MPCTCLFAITGRMEHWKTTLQVIHVRGVFTSVPNWQHFILVRSMRLSFKIGKLLASNGHHFKKIGSGMPGNIFSKCTKDKDQCLDTKGYSCAQAIHLYIRTDFQRIKLFLYLIVRYHSGGSMKLNACILILAHMVYL
jgi:hypothetical protein